MGHLEPRAPSTRRARWRALARVALAVALAANTVGAAVPASAETAAGRARQLARVQLHRNGNRGVAYLPRATQDGSVEPARFTLEPRRRFALPGDPQINVRSNFHPIDTDGDGIFELLQVNGSRLVRLWRLTGELVWSLGNPDGRAHRGQVHRDTLVVLDLDGDRRQELVHCWVEPGTQVKQLVLRRGATGQVLRRRALTGDDAGSECQLAAFKVRELAGPLILAAREVDIAGTVCAHRFIDTWSVTAAFDAELEPLWQRSTCDAGHYAWPLDENGDGFAEAVFVGKYQLRPDGSLRCTLAGWGADHVDTMLVADLDPARSGHEALAVGTSGVRLYAGANCAPLPLSLPPEVTNIQHMNAAKLDGSGAPAVLMRVRNTDTDKIKPVFRVDAREGLVSRFVDDNSDPQSTGRMPMTNANLDGAAAREDLVTWFGQVIDGDGRVRLDTSWYWGLQKLYPEEQDLMSYDKWTNAPVVVDLDGDGRDEMITWGRRLLVVGSLASPAPTARRR